MSVTVKLDEDLPPNAAHVLTAKGYSAATVLGQDMSGWKDADVWKTVQNEKRFFITADKGFSDIRMYPPGTHHGILLLRPDEDGMRPLVELLAAVLDSHNVHELSGTVTVATPRSIRVRRNPLNLA